jgi:hypothetical protein
MATEMYDLSRQPLPLRLLRVQQLREHTVEPLLLAEFAPDLEGPMLTAAQRDTSTERLLLARRVGARSA